MRAKRVECSRSVWGGRWSLVRYGVAPRGAMCAKFRRVEIRFIPLVPRFRHAGGGCREVGRGDAKPHTRGSSNITPCRAEAARSFDNASPRDWRPLCSCSFVRVPTCRRGSTVSRSPNTSTSATVRIVDGAMLLSAQLGGAAPWPRAVLLQPLLLRRAGRRRASRVSSRAPYELLDSSPRSLNWNRFT